MSSTFAYSSIKLVNLKRVRHVKCQANIRVVSTTTRTSTITQTYTPQVVDAWTGDLSINNYNTDNSTVYYSMYVSNVKMNVNVYDDKNYIFIIDTCTPECSVMENDEPEEVPPSCSTPLNSYDKSEANDDPLWEPDISGDESEL